MTVIYDCMCYINQRNYYGKFKKASISKLAYDFYTCNLNNKFVTILI